MKKSKKFKLASKIADKVFPDWKHIYMDKETKEIVASTLNLATVDAKDFEFTEENSRVINLPPRINTKFWRKAIKQACKQLPGWKHIYVDTDGTLFASDVEWEILYGYEKAYYVPVDPHNQYNKVTLLRLNAFKSFSLTR